jgi:hypothetical protein
MTNEQWEQLVERAKEHFDNVEVSTEDLVKETADGDQKQGTIDILLFENNAGRYKLVRENKHVLLEKTEHFSHRMGDTARTDYKFSETEFSHKLRVYKDLSFDEWEEITLDKLGM